MYDRLNKVRHFVLDMDGTIYLGNKILPRSIEFLEYLRATGRNYIFLTNNSSADSHYYAEKLSRMGIKATPDYILTSGEATVRYLKKIKPLARIFLLGVPSLEKEFTEQGFILTDDNPDFVVLGFDRTLTYEKLAIACNCLRRGVPLIATHADINCPTEDGYIPDCGAMLALIKASTGVEPTAVIGKPNELIMQMAMDKVGSSDKSEFAMVGDRLYTDIRMGNICGVTSIAVLSGEASNSDILSSTDKPTFVFEDLGAIKDILKNNEAI